MPAPHLPIRAFQWDLARQVEKLDWLLAQLPRYADWGYQELYLHLENAVEYPSLPKVARRGAYSYRQLERLVTAATRAGIGVVPIVNLLGHTQYLIRVPALRDLNELRAEDGTPLPAGQICPLHPRTLEVAELLLRDMRPFCTTGKVHVGLDESFHLGQHPLSSTEVARIGLPAHFANYVHRLQALNHKLGLRMGMWADMLYFLPDAIPLLPRGLIAYDWYYYPFRRHPKVELYNFAERDLATPLQRQGIEYWGCPMNGSFRYEPMPVFGERLANLRAWWRRCQAVSAQGFLVTSWEPNRLAMETTTLVDAAAAGLWLDQAPLTDQGLLARGVRRLFGAAPQSGPGIARAALQADCFAFAGYARWQISQSWRLASGWVRPERCQAELRFYEKLASSALRKSWPEPLSASWEFRRYLARRDYFVETGRAAVFALRRAVHAGQARSIKKCLASMQQVAAKFAAGLPGARLAARRMWGRTRRHAANSPNLRMLGRDRRQLAAWMQWVAAVKANPDHAWQSNPLCGRWQLFYEVWNCAPAVQLVAVEQLHGSTWIALKACHTIEFAAAAAASRSTVVRLHSVPLRPEGAAAEAFQLRLVLRGVGFVKVGRVMLTDGVRQIALTPVRPRWRKLGQPAPSHGLPVLTRSWILSLPHVLRSQLSAKHPDISPALPSR